MKFNIFSFQGKLVHIRPTLGDMRYVLYFSTKNSFLDFITQRLATAVTMVAKGVLKEHLILLANSMTCAGNFVGFNSSGYKALSRALNIQVPFTEATLFVSN